MKKSLLFLLIVILILLAILGCSPPTGPELTIPKNVVLTNLPDSITVETSTNISVSGKDVSHYQFKLNDNDYGSKVDINNNIIVLDSLSLGKHTLSVRGGNKHNIWQKEDTVYSWTIVESPKNVVLANLPDSVTVETSTNITVYGDNISHYKFKLDTSEYGDENAISDSTITSMNLSLGEHTLSVKGRNEYNIWQEEATVYSWTIVDSSKNVILTNLPNSITAETSVNISVSGNDISHYQFKLDDDDYGSEVDINNNIVLDNLNLGRHTISVKDVNSNDWQGEATIYSWTIVESPKNVVLTNLPDSITVETSTNIFVSGINVNHYKFKLNNGDYSSKVDINNNIVLDNLNLGKHTIYVKGRNAHNIWQKEDTVYSWTIVESPKNVVLTNLPDSITVETSINISVSGINVSHYQFKLDDDDYGSEVDINNNIIVLDSLSLGEHTLSVRGRNSIDWQEEDTVYSWTIVDDISGKIIIVNTSRAYVDESLSLDALEDLMIDRISTMAIKEVTHVTLYRNAYAFNDTLRNSIVGRNFDDTTNSGWTNLSDEQMINIANHINNVGMKVKITSEILPIIGDNDGWCTYKGKKVGEGKKHYLKPEGDFLEEQVIPFLEECARLAVKTNADILEVGQEYQKFSSNETFWSSAIASIKIIYSGKLIYSTNAGHYNSSNDEFDTLCFSLRDLDYLGCTAYPPYIAAGNNPSLDIIRTNLNLTYEKLKQRSKFEGKPLIITEIGCGSYDGALEENYAWEAWDSLFLRGKEVNETIQANFFQANIEKCDENVVGFGWHNDYYKTYWPNEQSTSLFSDINTPKEALDRINNPIQ